MELQIPLSLLFLPSRLSLPGDLGGVTALVNTGNGSPPARDLKSRKLQQNPENIVQNGTGASFDCQVL
jgi:hypothetical protein